MPANGQTHTLQDERVNRESREQVATPIYGLQLRTVAFPSGSFGFPGHVHFVQARTDQAVSTLPKGVIEAFVRTCERWRLGPREQIALLGYGTNMSAGFDILRGFALGLSRDVKDRAGYVLGISLGLGAVFNESAQAELDWLNTPHPKLNSRAPLAFMLEGRMANLIAVASLVADERAL
jgi:uncharacterized protein (DUF2384 family)